MTAKPLRRAKRTGKKLAFTMTAIGVIFFGLLLTVEQATVTMGLTSVPPAAVSATAAFIAGIATERYVLG